jgi:hypothetical protein
MHIKNKSMKIISTKVHGILDYAVAMFLILLPFMLGQDYSSLATLVFISAGIFTIIYSLFTNYEYSLRKIISMQTHLQLDTVQAIVLIASPWILGFYQIVFVPFLVVGILELLVIRFSTSQEYPIYSKEKIVTR